MPHVPLSVSEKFRGKSPRGLYGDVIKEIDWSVGQILAALKRGGLDQKTLVIFTSDNGPWLLYGNHAGSALPLREGKATSFDGGVRVPCIMRWPGQIPLGALPELAATIDLLPPSPNSRDQRSAGSRYRWKDIGAHVGKAWCQVTAILFFTRTRTSSRAQQP
jgi:hypothetical protein